MSNVAWAKSQRNPETDETFFLGLPDHGVDVAAVAERLMTATTLRCRLKALARRPLTGTDFARMGFFAGLHDAGKVNRGFQARLRKEKPDAGHIGPVWSILCKQASDPLLGSVRKALRRRDWKGWFAGREDETAWWNAVFAHHGGLPKDGAPPDRRLWDERGGYSPLSALAETAAMLRAMFPAAFEATATDRLPSATRFMHALAGIVTLADWLGSDRSVFEFPCEGAPTGKERIPWAREKAARLLCRRGLDSSVARRAAAAVPAAFADLFPDLPTSRPAQAALLSMPPPAAGQVVTLEAETGSGKTEAALLHFFRLFRAGEVDGLYFALPTRAAAVQIHRRVAGTLRRWLGDGAPPVSLAVPGYLRVDDQTGRFLPEGAGVLWPDEPDTDRVWAVERPKRYLSGAVMVGTVDQLLLGGLRVKHAHLRSGPMLRLLLVIDEVHASDAYMTEILRNVLNQHSTAGGHALLMSATLGALARLRFLSAGGRVEPHEGPALEKAAALPYPAVQRAGEELRRLDRDGREKRVRVRLTDHAALEFLLAQVRQQAGEGAAILFIRNTVRDAQETFRRLEDLGAPLLRCEGVTAPHHGRYAVEDRRLLDAALEGAFGKEGRAGVVAVTTQTAEQSLDICADRLIADIAPGDVLLQRIGRLHRHDRVRPVGFEEPTVDILAPTTADLAAHVGAKGEVRGKSPMGLGRVYRNLIGVLATRRWLGERDAISIPRDNRALVEAATHDESLRRLANELGPPWEAHLNAALGEALGEGMTARSVLLDWRESLFANRPQDDRRVKTRLGLDDRRIDLPEPLQGPFGARVRSFTLPGWMAGDLCPEAQPEEISACRGEIRFRLGARRYRYDRLGLSMIDG